MQPILDKDFIPAIIWNRNFLKNATKDISIAVERETGLFYRYDAKIGSNDKDNAFYIERLVKMMLYVFGGITIYVNDEGMAKYLSECYSENGLRSFDKMFMERVFEKEFKVVYTDAIPQTKDDTIAVGRKMNGFRVGLDLGGSDMKVSSMRNGDIIFAEEVVWLPMLNDNSAYHYEQIRNVIALGVEKLGGKIDAIGISTPGVCSENRIKIASMFIKVPIDEFNEKVKDIYINVAKGFGVPVSVVNDGDVAALAGSIWLRKNNILGIAMGTSEAAGFIDRTGNITGRLNELAFAPVDYNTSSIHDEWSDDFGVGSQYFSQDAVIRLAPLAGITLPDHLTPPEKLKEVQELLQEGHSGARKIFETIGVYFGYAIAYYAEFYDIEYVQVLGRVLSGEGGDIIIEKANAVLNEEFPELTKKFTLYVPCEYEKRIGQSIAAASL